jgi:filamentous hemagglutinin family protein
VIQNIFSRVTGGNISKIFGTLGVLGNANLYLINPNGIMFGPNARLDMRGAFVGSTADSLLFNNNYDFSASNPTAPPLLTVDIPLGVRFRENTGDINSTANLSTPSDLTLQGGNVNLTGSVVAGGNLRLEALDTLTIRDTVENPFFAVSGLDLLIQGNNIDIFALNNVNSAIASYGNLTLKSPNPVIGDAHYYSGGNFRIEKLDSSLGELYSPNDPVIRTGGDVFIGAYEGASLHIIAGGSVTIPGYVLITGADAEFGLQETVTLSNGQEIFIDGKNTPTLDIRAGVREEFIGTPLFEGSGLDFFIFPSFSQTATSADINVGTIIFSRNPNDGTQKITGDVLLTNQYQPNPNLQGSITLNPSFGNTAIGTSSFLDGGRVIIDSKANILVSGDINSFAFGQNGRGGDVLFNSVGDIFLFSSNINVLGSQGGNISFNANNIDIIISLLLSGIQQGLGFENAQGGDIRLNAKENISIDSSLIANGVLTNAIGNAGNTIINTSDLFITNGTQINSNTVSSGNAGSIKINASNSIFIRGESPLLGTSGIFSQVQATGIGDSQGIVINTSTLTLQNGANIDSSTFGKGKAGLIDITANESINITGESSLSPFVIQSGITSQVIGEGDSKGILINTPNLNLIDGGRIDASTLGKGDAGKIEITSTNGNILLMGESSLGQVSTISSQVQTGIEGEGNSGGIVIYPVR